MLKGISKEGAKYRVRKYGNHVGIYSTYDEAVEAVNKAEDEQVVFNMMQQYYEAKEFLIKRGLLCSQKTLNETIKEIK